MRTEHLFYRSRKCSRTACSAVTAMMMAAVLAAMPSCAYAADQVVISDYGPVSSIAETETAGTEADTAETSGTDKTSAAQAGTVQTGNAETGAAPDTAAQTNTAETGTAQIVNNALASAASLPDKGADTQAVTDLVNSDYAVLFDLDQNKMVAEKNADAVINPASMTKVLTLLVVCEHVQNLDEKLTVTQATVDYINAHDCSNAGLSAGETISVRDLLYALILPSGADAALTLASRTAGSPEQFVTLMNQKAKALGLSSGANFTNCIGLYSQNHHCTVKDVAVIMKAALSNSLAASVLTTPAYKVTTASRHTGGISLTNLFVSRISGKISTGNVYAAKTGYVSQSGFCAVSYLKGSNGRNYICVTGKADSTWKAIYDHTALYQNYVK